MTFQKRREAGTVGMARTGHRDVVLEEGQCTAPGEHIDDGVMRE